MTDDELALRIAQEWCGVMAFDELCDKQYWLEFARRLRAAWQGEPVAFVAEVYQSRYTIELNGHDLAEGMPLYASLSAPASEALDCVKVPREPTEAMISAGVESCVVNAGRNAKTYVDGIYKVMLDAALSASEGGKEGKA